MVGGDAYENNEDDEKAHDRDILVLAMVSRLLVELYKVEGEYDERCEQVNHLSS
jgi:hypothetical protein